MHPRVDADDLLLARFRAGDEAAFTAVFDGWSGAAFQLAVRILGNDADAEEVVEETFWQLWRTRESFDAQRGGLTTWILTIARSRALDRCRAVGRRRENDSHTSGIDRMPAAAQPDPAEVDEMRRLVRAALDELGREQREVLELAYFDGLSQSEIAERTAQPLGTVKTRARLGLAKLRDRLSVLGRNA